MTDHHLQFLQFLRDIKAGHTLRDADGVLVYAPRPALFARKIDLSGGYRQAVFVREVVSDQLGWRMLRDLSRVPPLEQLAEAVDA